MIGLGSEPSVKQRVGSIAEVEVVGRRREEGLKVGGGARPATS
jgi:hypothetical protein